MKDLAEKLKKYGYEQTELFVEKEINANNITFLKLRDKLFMFAHILEEEIENKIYVVELKPSKFSHNVVIAMKLRGNRLFLCGFCKLDSSKQSTTIRAINLIEDTINDKGTIKKSYRKSMIIYGIIVIVLIICLAIIFNVIKIIRATERYNIEVEKYNATVLEYNDLTTKGDFSTISDMPKKMESLSIQNTDFISSLRVFFSENNVTKISNDTSTINDMTKANENVILMAKQVVAPEQEFVMERLKEVEIIDAIESVTEQNDVNGLLGKENGYYGCVYFSTNLLDNNEILGNSLVDKGTDGGGAIEIFSDVNSAKERCEYLASFDGTVLTTGSYALVGTMVIRTSYKLDSTEQYKITDEIVKELTSIK